MLIVGENLKSLIKQHAILEDISNCFDETSISLSLDNTIIEIDVPKESFVTFGEEIPSSWIKQKYIPDNEFIILKPQTSFLACSFETISIPLGYFGLLQTKGSLARLFISIHCNDSQIDPGFKGKVTFEIVNLSQNSVRIKPLQKIGALYLFKTSTNKVKPYSGKYNNSNIPTIQK